MERKITSELVDKLADGLMFDLTPDENEIIIKALEYNYGDEDRLIEIPNLSDYEPMTHCLDDFIYELKEDEAQASIPRESFLKNCDDYIDAEVKLPRMVG